MLEEPPPPRLSSSTCSESSHLAARERLPTSLQINDVLEVRRYHVLFRLRFTISQSAASSDLTTKACREIRTHSHTPHNRVARAKKCIFSRSWNRQAAHGRRQESRRTAMIFWLHQLLTTLAEVQKQWNGQGSRSRFHRTSKHKSSVLATTRQCTSWNWPSQKKCVTGTRILNPFLEAVCTTTQQKRKQPQVQPVWPTARPACEEDQVKDQRSFTKVGVIVMFRQ